VLRRFLPVGEQNSNAERNTGEAQFSLTTFEKWFGKIFIRFLLAPFQVSVINRFVSVVLNLSALENFSMGQKQTTNNREFNENYNQTVVHSGLTRFRLHGSGNHQYCHCRFRHEHHSFVAVLGYESYLIQYRQTLDPSDSWSALTNAYPANSTNRTTFTIFGVVPQQGGNGGNFSGGSGSPPSPSFASSLMTTMDSGLMAVPVDGAGGGAPVVGHRWRFIRRVLISPISISLTR
jgi:hypothetical protein